MTLLNTSGVLVILTVILLLWFVPRSLRRAPAGPVMEPERPLISAERTAEDILASAGVLLNESEAYQSSDHAVAPGTSLPSSALPQASSSHAVDDSVQPAPDTASISQIRESSPTAPYTDAIPVVEEAKPSVLSYFDTSNPSGIVLLVAAGLGVLALVTGLLALFAGLAWGWAVLFLILAGGAWAVSRSGLLESLAHQVKANRDERRAKAEAEGAEGDDAEDEAYEGSEDDEAYDDAPESVDGPGAEGPDSEVTEESEPQSRPATRKPAARKSAGNLNREAARPSRAHIAVEASEDAPEAIAREAVTREEAPAPSQAARPVRPAAHARSAATASTEPPAAHRPERRQQRPSRFQPIRRGSVLFDQESGSAAHASVTRASSATAPRTAGQPRVAQAQVAQPQAAQAQISQPQPVQPAQVQKAPAVQPVAPQPAQPAQPVAAAAQQPAIHPDQPVARQALRDGSPVRQAPAAQPIPEEIPLPDVLDDSEFDALDIASLNDPAHSTGATATGGVRATNRHPGAGSSFEAVSNTWNPVQLPKPLSALHRQDQGKNQGKK